MRQGADPNTIDEYGDTPLHIAAALGLTSIVSMLVRGGSNIEALNLSDSDTPLMVAVIHGKTDTAMALLTLRAHTETFNKLNSTPLHIAACDNSIRLMLKLIKSGAAINTEISSSGWTALHMAAGLNRPMAIAVLIRYGADVNTADFDGDTPLMSACSLGYIDCVQQLLAGGANPRILNQVSFEAIRSNA